MNFEALHSQKVAATEGARLIFTENILIAAYFTLIKMAFLSQKQQLF